MFCISRGGSVVSHRIRSLTGQDTKMETVKDAVPVLHDRMRIASDLLRFIGASVLAGVITACVVSAVVMLLSGSGA
jgi:hypothetical protein